MTDGVEELYEALEHYEYSAAMDTVVHILLQDAEDRKFVLGDDVKQRDITKRDDGKIKVSVENNSFAIYHHERNDEYSLNLTSVFLGSPPGVVEVDVQRRALK